MRCWVFEVLKKVFGAKRDEVVEEWRGLCDEELYDLYCLPNIIWVIKSKEREGWDMYHLGRRGEVQAGR
jgi:hypothetical protein